MALTSPGVQVSVVDESFYTPAEPGTVPMIFVASTENKSNAAGSGIAQGTTKENANKPYLLTSQRDLAETFGDPAFQIDANNNPIHGSELNEYGLQAAYSFLGVSNRAYVMRADIDLSALEPSVNVPKSDPDAGTYWFDTSATLFGLQVWNNAPVTTLGGQSFTNVIPLVITNEANVVDAENGDFTPSSAFGAIGDYAIVAVGDLNQLWYRNTNGAWVEAGSDDWKRSWPTVTSSKKSLTFDPSSFQINNVSITINQNDEVQDIADTITQTLSVQGITASVLNNELVIYADSDSGPANDGAVEIANPVGGDTTALVDLGIAAGTYYPADLQISPHTTVPDSFKRNSITQETGRPTGSVWIKTTTPNLGARWRVKQWNADTRLWDNDEAPLHPNNETALLNLDRTGGGSNLSIGSLYVQTNVAGDNLPLGTFKIYRRSVVGSTVVTTTAVTDQFVDGQSYSFTLQSTRPGTSTLEGEIITFAAAGDASDAGTIAAAITNANVANVFAEVDNSNRIIIKHSKGGDIRAIDGAGAAATLNNLGITAYNPDTKTGTRYVIDEPGIDNTLGNPLQFRMSNWEPLNYTPSANEPSNNASDGQLWYNSIVDEVDIMINNGTHWVGYQYDGTTDPAILGASPVYNGAGLTDANGPIVSASRPTQQSTGSELQTGDLWIDTSDLENYPVIYKFSKATGKWTLVDNGDQTTDNGILFADVRYGSSGVTGNTAASIKELLTTNYVDPDCPDPTLYPKGMLLFNLRRSGFNVKEYKRDYIDTTQINTRFGDEQMGSYAADRWVTASANNVDGSGSFGRNAQRKVVLQAMQAGINSSEEIRNVDARGFNLIAAPGYPEMIGEMVTLNYDRGLTSFVVGDSPARLDSSATSLNEWATNVNAVVEDNDNGLVTSDEYLAVFYPWGFTSDNFGNNVVIPPSHMMLRTIALSDQVSYPWFAPAGTRRGGITNATATGYINNEGDFVSVALNEGQRDTLYSSSINPVTFITGAGIVNFGQKTRARNASSLDRINVARLVVYLRSQLNALAKPYIFEPNDKITRDEIKQQTESLLLELVGQRALYDFLVVCDETNNTPSRIDRNELYLDIAIEPVKAIEFIYIPLRLKNTGEIQGTLA